METLAADVQPSNNTEASVSSQGSPDDGEDSTHLSVRRQASSQYADSVQSLLAGRVSSNAAAGPGPGSPQHDVRQPGRSVHRRNDTASSRLPSPGSPPAVADSQDVPAEGRSARSELTTRRSLSFSEATPESEAVTDCRQAEAQAPPARRSLDRVQVGRPSPRQLGKSPRGKSGHHDDSFARCGHLPCSEFQLQSQCCKHCLSCCCMKLHFTVRWLHTSVPVGGCKKLQKLLHISSVVFAYMFLCNTAVSVSAKLSQLSYLMLQRPSSGC